MKAKKFTKALCSVLIAGMLLSSIGCGKINDDVSGSDSDSDGTSAFSDTSSLDSSTDKSADKSTDKSTDKSKETNKNNKETTKDSTQKETVTNRKFKLNTTNKWTYTTDSRNGVKVRNLTIDTGWGGETVTVSQLSDIHINYCTENDLKDPVLNSTYQNRKWLKNFGSRTNLENSMMTAKDSDMVVLSGDVYDYYSEGVVQKTNEYIFNKYDNVVACMGNHEPVRQMQGTVTDTKSTAELRQLVSSNWCNDITYDSFVIKEKVMIVLLDNSSGKFLSAQIPLFKADLQKARNNGYAVLVFYHIPLDTGNPDCAKIQTTHKNDWDYAYLYGRTDLTGPASTGADKQVYDLICNNGDIIKGCFCGHYHSDFYSEIVATTPSGLSTIIPQYIITSVAGDKGHVLNITIK